MDLMVSTNFDDHLIACLKRHSVYEVYGKLPRDFIGGGRPAKILPKITKRDMRRHIKELHKNGIKFNYVLNAVSLGNKEFTSAGQKKIFQLLDFLADAQVDGVVVAMPYLFQLIKKYYPKFLLHTSSFANVNCPQRAKYWESMGADTITLLSKELNRDFFMLKEIRKSVRCRLEVIANNSCLEHCPIDFYHQNLNTYASKSCGNCEDKGQFIDYCVLYCNYWRFINPMGFIQSDWIRPEDVHYYEKIGIDSLKIVDRSMSTEDLARIVEAYMHRRYEGNLLDLLHVHFKRHFDILANVSNFKQHPKDLVYVDNRKLDSFLKYFWVKDCRLKTKENYNYCLKTAKKVVKIDPYFKKEISSAYKMKKTQFFRVGGLV